MGGNFQYGPIFGIGNDLGKMSDQCNRDCVVLIVFKLVIVDDCHQRMNFTKVNHTYKLPDDVTLDDRERYFTGDENFLVDEMEVFVVKRMTGGETKV